MESLLEVIHCAKSPTTLEDGVTFEWLCQPQGPAFGEFVNTLIILPHYENQNQVSVQCLVLQAKASTYESIGFDVLLLDFCGV